MQYRCCDCGKVVGVTVGGRCMPCLPPGPDAGRYLPGPPLGGPGRCRHCRRSFPRVRSRGLCSTCYQYAEVRCLYPCRDYRLCDSEEGSKLPLGPAKEPTAAGPGTEEKIRVLAQRVENREELWHPDDEVGMARLRRGLRARKEGELVEERRLLIDRETYDAIDSDGSAGEEEL